MNIKIDKFFYNNRKIFDDVNLEINNKVKYSVSGANGTGKTTLLRIIMGEIIGNNIQIKDKLKNVLYYSKELNVLNELSLMENLQIFRRNYDFETVEKICKGLNFVEVNKKINQLSEGNKTKVLLISILSIKKYSLLVLDEPTENLDLDSISFLQNFLIQIEKPIVLVSHTFAFRDNICSTFLEIDNCKIKIHERSASN